MEKNKAQELINLTQTFCEKFQKLAGKNCEDLGMILTLRIEDDDNTHHLMMAHGTRKDEMLALHHFEKESGLVKEYAKIRSLPVLANMLHDILGDTDTNEGLGDTSPSEPADKQPSDSDEQPSDEQ